MEPIKDEQRKSRLARIAGREGELASTAMLSFSKNQSKHQFKRLYMFDRAKELEEWELPFDQKRRTRPSGQVMQNTVLPPLNNSVIVEEDMSPSMSLDLDGSMLSMFQNQSRKRGNSMGSKAQETLFVDRESYIFRELKKIRTGEDAISFFAKNGNTTPVKFLHCNKADDHNKDFRPYDLVVVPEKEVDNEYYTISAQGVVNICQRNEDGNSMTTFYSLSD